MESPVLRTRVREALRDRIHAPAECCNTTVPVFVRQALADRCEAVATVRAASLRAQALQAADDARAEGDLRLARLLDGLLLAFDTACAMYGPVVP